MKEKGLYIIAIIGSVICFIGDNLLGFYAPTPNFGNKIVGIKFSYEWAEVNPIRFAVAGFFGVVALIMMFAGMYAVYLRMKNNGDNLSRPFLLSSFLFVSVGTLYHNVFAITAYIFNRLSPSGMETAQTISMEIFNTYILVGALAAVGYAGLVILFFISGLRGNIYPHRYMCLINPFIIMILSLILSKILPQTPIVNGFFGMGQQSIGLFITFVALYMTTGETKRY